MVRNQSVLITPPAAKIWDLDNLKSHLRIRHSSDDDIIGDYADAAAETMDGVAAHLQIALISQTWRDFWPSFFGNAMLRLHPVQSIASITYLDADLAEQVLPAESYYLAEEADGARVYFNDGATDGLTLAPRTDAVRVNYVCGYGDAMAAVPQRIRQAHRLLVAHYYENREAVMHLRQGKFDELPYGVKNLLAPFRRFGVESWSERETS